MKRAILGMLVVFLLTVAFASRGDSAKRATKKATMFGCVTNLFHDMRQDGKVQVAVKVSSSYYYFHTNKSEIFFAKEFIDHW